MGFKQKGKIMYFILHETKFETRSSSYTIVDFEGYEKKETALDIAKALQSIATAKDKSGVIYSVLSQENDS